jgi:hypothetical protein
MEDKNVFDIKGFLKDVKDSMLSTDVEVEEVVEEEVEKDIKTFTVELKPIWSLFKYLYKPQSHNLMSIYNDDRLYFTIPLGPVDELGKFNYITFPLCGSPEEVTEFYYNSITNSIYTIDESEEDEA